MDVNYWVLEKAIEYLPRKNAFVQKVIVFLCSFYYYCNNVCRLLSEDAAQKL